MVESFQQVKDVWSSTTTCLAERWERLMYIWLWVVNLAPRYGRYLEIKALHGKKLH